MPPPQHSLERQGRQAYILKEQSLLTETKKTICKISVKIKILKGETFCYHLSYCFLGYKVSPLKGSCFYEQKLHLDMEISFTNKN